LPYIPLPKVDPKIIKINGVKQTPKFFMDITTICSGGESKNSKFLIPAHVQKLRTCFPIKKQKKII
jgi:hypothetical protein